MRRYEGKDYPRHASDDEPAIRATGAMRFVAYAAVVAYILGALLVVALLVMLVWLAATLALSIGG